MDRAVIAEVRAWGGLQAAGGILQHLDLSGCRQVTDLGLMGLESRSHRASLASVRLIGLPRCTTAGLAFVALGVGRSKKEQQSFLRHRYRRRVARAKKALLETGFLLKGGAGALAEKEDSEENSEEEEGEEEGKEGVLGDEHRSKAKTKRATLPSAAAFKYGKAKAADGEKDAKKKSGTSEPEKLKPMDIKKMNGDQLKDSLKERKLEIQGAKKDLIKRLLDFEAARA